MTDDVQLSKDDLCFLRGGGRMAEQIGCYDWQQSPLGSIGNWPQSLKTTLGNVLGTGFPTYVAWGPQLIGFHNDAFIPLLGQKDALGRPFQDTWAEAWPQLGPIVQRALAGETSTFEDLPIMVERHGGPERGLFTLCCSPVRAESGDVCGVLCTVVETTGAALMEKRTRFQLVLADCLRGSSTPDEVTRSTCSLLGRHLTARRVGFALVSRKKVDIQLPGWNDGSVQSVVGQSFPLESCGEPVNEELRSGRTVRISDVEQDPRTRDSTVFFERLRAPSMLLVPVMREAVLIAVLAVAGRERRQWTDDEVAIVEDTAERTRSAVEHAISQQSRTRAEAYYRFILDCTLSAVIVHGPGGEITFANPIAAEALGIEGKSLVGRLLSDPAWRLVRLDGSPLPQEEFPASIVARTHEPLKAHVVGALRWEDSEPSWFLVNAFPQLDDSGHLQNTVVSFVDITEHIAIEKQLQEAGRRKDEFLAMLAHELRNPLAPICTGADLLTHCADDPSRVRAATSVIARQASHMSHLLDDLLDASRVNRGLIKLNHELLELSSIVASAIEQARHLIDARGHDLIVQVPPGSLAVTGDRVRLIQVVTNLLNNAARYTPPGGKIEVRIEQKAEILELSVSDNGAGIDPAFLPHVFDLFSQGAHSQDQGQGGLGIGLSLVRTLVELHGGQVRAHSDGLGCGTAVFVSLPKARHYLGGAESSAGRVAEAPRALRLLLVDDNADAADMMADVLRLYGHDVLVAYSGAQALELGRGALPFDALILDIGLPDMSGYELAAELRGHECCRNSTLIALTGYGQPHDREKSRLAGFDHHLVKPLKAERMLEALASIR